MKSKMKIVLFMLILTSNVLISEIEKPDIVLIDSVGHWNRFCYTEHLEFIDSLKGYRMLCDSDLNRGFILQKTLDGGYEWKTIYLDTSRFEVVDGKILSFPPLRCFYMNLLPNGTLKLFCSKVIYYQDYTHYDYALILTSTDEGTSWSSEKFDSLSAVHIYHWKNSPVIKIEFSKSDNRKPFLQNKYYTSLDNGQTWELMQFPDTMMERTYGQFQLVDSNTIFIKFSVDTAYYASQWELYPYLYKIKEKKWEKYNIPRYYLSPLHLLFFRTIDDVCTIYKVQYNGENKYKRWDTYLVRSVNRGQSWDTLVDMSIYTEFDSGLLYVTYLDSLNIIGYGYHYDLIKTTDGGRSWRHLFHKLGTRKDMNELSKDPNHDQKLMQRYMAYMSFKYASWPIKDHLWVVSTQFPWSHSYLFKYKEYPNAVKGFQDTDKRFIFPNPARTTTRLNLQYDGEVTISAADILGRSFPLWSGYATAGEMELDVSSLPAGSYNLLINYGTKVDAVRMIKE